MPTSSHVVMRTSPGTLLALLCLLSLGFCNSLLGQEIVWQRDIQRAVDESARSGRPMLIKASTDWCHYCKKMQRETFSDQRIASHVNACFIPVYLDGDIHKSLVRRLGIRSYPTTVVVNPQMQIVTRITGYRTVSQLSKDLSRVCNHPAPTRQRVAASEPSLKASIFGTLCPVSPIERGEFTNGSDRITGSYRGYQLSFSSEEHRAKFESAPEKYWPIADGRCVVSLRAKQASSGNLKHGAVYRGRVWLFSTAENKSAFESDPNLYATWFDQVASRQGRTVSRPSGERTRQSESISR